MQFRLHSFVFPVLAAVAVSMPCVAADSADWPNVGNDKGGTRYSTLDQINRGNVAQLKVAWTYHVGDAGKGTTIECTPLVVDGVMYVTTVKTKVVALDAATGQERWSFDPYDGFTTTHPRASGGVNRGVAYWAGGSGADAKRRVIVGVADGRIISLDARTGKPDPAFADRGTLDLRAGIERDVSATGYGPTSAPAVLENLVIVGCSNDEGHPGA